METAIGVFASRGHAEEAVRELLQQHVPEQSIVFLTRSENEAKGIGKEFGAFVGGFTGGAAGMSARGRGRDPARPWPRTSICLGLRCRRIARTGRRWYGRRAWQSHGA